MGDQRSKVGLPAGKRVFLGEYGYPVGRNDFESKGYKDPKNQYEQDQFSRNVMRAAIEWGVPYALIWQLYDNETKWSDGTENGFWLIDDENEKQEVYYTHFDYYKEAKDQVESYMTSNGGSLPSDTQMRAIALNILTGSVSARDGTKKLAVENQITKERAFLFYPNPVKNLLKIESNENIKYVKIYDMLGDQHLLLENILGNKISMNLSTLKAGQYFILVVNESGKTKVKKMMRR